MIIIDGHNLLHAICKAEEDNQALSDIQLCRIIGRYLKLIRETGEIVFDGTGPREKSGFDNIKNLDVSFAGPGSDADTVIERKIKASTAPKRLTVVSSDRKLRKAGQVRKAKVFKAEVFWNNVGKRLRRKKTIKEPIEKTYGTDRE